MKISIVTSPVLEPITLSSLKLHLRLDSGSLADEIDESQSLVPDNYGISAGGLYTHEGTGIDVLGYTCLVVLNSGTNGAGGTVDAKIQESDDNITYTDWTGGAFTQVTTANDNAIQEKSYTGTKRYIRVVAKVLVATCDFSATVIRLTGDSTEDDLLTAIIQAAREQIEDITRRALLTQTWDYYLQGWPSSDRIKIPFGNLQSVTSVKWKDSDGDETTLTVTTDYLVETNGEGCGSVVLPYGESWPSGTLYPSNPITIRFICGWEAAADIPSKIRTANKMLCTDLYSYRGTYAAGTMVENAAVDRLLASVRIWEEF